MSFPQLLICDGHAFVVEVAARVPAGQMADLVYHAVGVDLIEIAFRQALGRPVDDELVQVGEPRPAVIRFFTAEPGILPTGRVVAVDGLEEVREAPWGTGRRPLSTTGRDDQARPGRRRSSRIRCRDRPGRGRGPRLRDRGYAQAGRTDERGLTDSASGLVPAARVRPLQAG